MHDVVEMLLSRIKDYPEDFVAEPIEYERLGGYREPTKWYRALKYAETVMTEEEKVVISDALELAKRAIYMGAALKTIMSDEVQEENQKKQYFGTVLGHALTDTRELLTSSVLRNQASQTLLG